MTRSAAVSIISSRRVLSGQIATIPMSNPRYHQESDVIADGVRYTVREYVDGVTVVPLCGGRELRRCGRRSRILDALSVTRS